MGVPKGLGISLVKEDTKSLHRITKYPADILKTDKVALLKTGYEAAKSYNEVISQVTGTT